MTESSHWETPLDEIHQPTPDELLEAARAGTPVPRTETVLYYEADEPAITLVLDAFQASELYRCPDLELAATTTGAAIADGDHTQATVEQRALADVRQKIGESMGFDVREWLPPAPATEEGDGGSAD